jgi:adenylate cyclase
MERNMDKEKGVIILISLSVVFLIAGIIYFKPPIFNEWVIKLESDTYDREVRRFHKPLSSHPSVAIVGIDDRSLAEEGKWPWNRSKIAQMTQELTRLGASVIAFDMVFSEPDENPVDPILKLTDNPDLTQELEQIRPLLDTDTLLASALKKTQSTLGFVFTSDGKETGSLPAPLLVLSKEDADRSLIPSLDGYIGNQPIFQEAASHGGFMNTTIDADGILRFSPLLMRENEKVYPSLALQATQVFLSTPFSGIATSLVDEHQVVQSIRLGNTLIPTDPWGRILIPFRGRPYSFPYLSASDLLNGKIEEEQVRDKLIFIGLSATAASDLVATAISPVFPGVEVQASIASGIIDHYLPHKPNWGRGAAIALVLILGIGAAITFPYISKVVAFLGSALIILILEGVNYWVWTRHQIVLAFFFPMPTLVTLFILDLISAYIADIREKKKNQ